MKNFYLSIFRLQIAAFDCLFRKGKVSFQEMRAWISGLVTNQAGQLHNESKIFAQKC